MKTWYSANNVAFRSALVALCAAGWLCADENSPLPEVTPAVNHDVSPPLRDMSRRPLAGPKHEKPLFRFHGPVSQQPDPVLQTVSGPLVATTTVLNMA